MSVVVSDGYAPFEQYHRKGRQGPWTDIYAAAAVLYRLVTGETPPEAPARMAGEALRPTSAYGVSAGLSATLDEALSLTSEARPQTIHSFQARLVGAASSRDPFAAKCRSHFVAAKPIALDL